MLTFELSEDERAALIELLRAEIDDNRFPLAPRLRPLRSILAKLAPETAPAVVYPAPKRLGNRARRCTRSGGGEDGAVSDRVPTCPRSGLALAAPAASALQAVRVPSGLSALACRHPPGSEQPSGSDTGQGKA